MKLLTYRRAGGIHHGQLVDADTVAEWGDGDLADALGGDGLRPPAQARGTYPRATVEILAPVLRPGKALAVAANYQEHVTESGSKPLDKSTLAPRLFLKPTTSITGPGAAIRKPDETTQLDWEAELVVVIGRTASGVSVGDALNYVAGYAVGNDISARSVDYGYPREVGTPGASAVWFFDWLVGKSFDGFAPFGPFLVTADDVADPQDLAVTLDVNGRRRQDGNTSQMIFTVAELVAFASRVTTLEPGDLIFTGTPSGVGAATGEYLSIGDVMEVRIGDLGVLVNTIT